MWWWVTLLIWKLGISEWWGITVCIKTDNTRSCINAKRHNTLISAASTGGTELTYVTVMGLPSVRPTPSIVKLQSCSGSGKGFIKLSSAVTDWFTLTSPSSCRKRGKIKRLHHARVGIVWLKWCNVQFYYNDQIMQTLKILNTVF